MLRQIAAAAWIDSRSHPLAGDAPRRGRDGQQYTARRGIITFGGGDIGVRRRGAHQWREPVEQLHRGGADLVVITGTAERTGPEGALESGRRGWGGWRCGCGAATVVANPWSVPWSGQTGTPGLGPFPYSWLTPRGAYAQLVTLVSGSSRSVCVSRDIDASFFITVCGCARNGVPRRDSASQGCEAEELGHEAADFPVLNYRVTVPRDSVVV